MTLFSDPEKWLRSVVGSPLRTYSSIVFQLGLGVIFYMKFADESWVAFFFFCGFALPAMYVYAAYRVLALKDENSPSELEWRLLPDWTILLFHGAVLGITYWACI